MLNFGYSLLCAMRSLYTKYYAAFRPSPFAGVFVLRGYVLHFIMHSMRSNCKPLKATTKNSAGIINRYKKKTEWYGEQGSHTNCGHLRQRKNTTPRNEKIHCILILCLQTHMCDSFLL